MLGALAAGALPSLTNSGPVTGGAAGPSNAEATGGTTGAVTVSTGGGAGRAPGWVWPAVAGVGLLVAGVVALKMMK